MGMPSLGFDSLPREASLLAVHRFILLQTRATCHFIYPLVPLRCCLQSLPDIPSLSESPSLTGPNTNSTPSSFPLFYLERRGE